MESPQNIKKRLKSVNNIGQITKAMELVSATKMRKSQEIALASRPYSFAALDLLANLTLLENLKKEELPELLRQRKVSKVLFVLVASDKGLAGAFNSSVFRKFELHMKRDEEKYPNEEHLFLAVGEKSSAYLTKKGFKIAKKFVQAGDYTTPEDVKPITDFIVQGYLDKKWDRVVIISTHFRTALKQEPHIRRFLPIDFDHIADAIREIVPERGKFAELIKEQSINFVPTRADVKDYLIEPSAKKVLERLVKHLCFMQMYHLVLEANASEHSARRMAMKTASDNASDLSVSLNLQYNKSRQSKITTEISEISAGAEAQSQ
ncbi:MAG: ATP synthase F1 subunit gamma [Candidatus Staskawiczbacteria bacterium]|nr:ATP synthase F1 subunit gamma [Candidatus Staskawiczbacteria bacterium]